jgi:hypothetical protein
MQLGVHTLLAALAALVLTAHGAAAAAIDGEAKLWANPQTRYVIIGEVHGTNETPSLFGDLACDAHRSGRPIVVALEVSERSQGAIDAYLASDGGPAARSRFLEDPHWNQPFKDGRSSLAYLLLFEELRVCLERRYIAAVVAIQPYGHPGWTANDANMAMAALIQHAAERHPSALVVLLVGSCHATKRPLPGCGERDIPAAAHLPAQATISLKASTGGEAWNCTGPTTADCGVRAWPGDLPRRRGVQLGVDAPDGFDGTIDLGVPATASPPAVTSHPSNAAG